MNGKAVHRARVRWGDAIRYHPATEAAKARLEWWRASIARSPVERLDRLLRAYRHATDPGQLGAILADVHRIEDQVNVDELLARNPWTQSARRSSVLDRSLILKPPGGPDEPGLLLLHLEPNWLRFLIHRPGRAAIAARYQPIFSSGWSPTDYALLWCALRVLPGPLWVQTSNHGEDDKLRQFDGRIRLLPTMGCDWIRPEYYRRVPRDQRPIDLVMVANWAPFKRHWHLFDALRRMPKSLRIALVGQTDGPHSVERVQKLAEIFDVRQNLEFFNNLKVEAVQELLEQSKVSLILSRREGHCVAVAESLFADTPVGLLEGAHVGPLQYIQAETGRRLCPRRLAADLEKFLEESASMRPRDWAEQNISCHRSAEVVNQVLASAAIQEGRPWTQPMATPCWRPYPAIVDSVSAERIRPAWAELHRAFPDLFGPDFAQAPEPPGDIGG